MVVADKYVIGSKNIPVWVNEYSRIGKIKFNFDDGELIDVTVNIQNKIEKALPGDVLLRTKNGIMISKQQKKVIKESDD